MYIYKTNTKEGSLEHTIDEWVCVTALNVSNGRRQKASSAIAICVAVTVGGHRQPKKTPNAMGKRVLFCTVAYSIECEEGKRSNG